MPFVKESVFLPVKNIFLGSISFVQHIEFFDIDHFENNYHRVKATGNLSLFIDFFWETKFDLLLKENPEGFSDALFPNIGYT